MGKRPRLLYEALQRLDGLMALGQSRADAKAQARAQGEHFWSFSDGKMHSYQTRATYQDMVMRFLRWCRANYGTKRLVDVDQRADELASASKLDETPTDFWVKPRKSARNPGIIHNAS
ncbi:hypothetical protein KSD_70180 [Ktedonobacter sp. SOSP1-85]|uniref:hypothetical protein n=1 Tax=Ktedonobacter sp. SOSP1-85 TaxID=2778367 RepID=UPI001A2ECB44|nr:hypothetical protein [Ktedonobacter sp. SOSP1-85]GHO79247.1 hypothetical protein KSD_70180 [Ktedonobacter sp. SOSP1-85]